MRLFGKNQVAERINTNPASIRKIYFNKASGKEPVYHFALKKGIPVQVLDDEEFSRLAGQNHTQGIIAETEEFVYADLENILSLPKEKKPVLLVLSNLTDPQNLGSILRTAACFGSFAVIIPKHRSAPVTETVLKVACGGENYVPVVQAVNLTSVLEEAKKSGYWVVGTVVEEGENIINFKLPFPLCLVIGSEDSGIRKGLLEHLDFKVTLPMPGKGLSLNAAVSCAIFCYESMRQKPPVKS